MINFIDEARKQFRTYVNILSTLKNEDGEKYLVLRKKYLNELPSDDAIASYNPSNSTYPDSPGARTSQASSQSSDPEIFASPRQPPPYRPPPEIKTSEKPPPGPLKLPFLEPETEYNYRDCVGEFQTVLSSLKPPSRQSSREDRPPTPPPKRTSLSRETSIDQNIGIPIVRSNSRDDDKENENVEKNKGGGYVKEATQIFNRKATEDTKIPSPLSKGLKKEQDAKVSVNFFTISILCLLYFLFVGISNELNVALIY